MKRHMTSRYRLHVKVRRLLSGQHGDHWLLEYRYWWSKIIWCEQSPVITGHACPCKLDPFMCCCRAMPNMIRYDLKRRIGNLEPGAWLRVQVLTPYVPLFHLSRIPWKISTVNHLVITIYSLQWLYASSFVFENARMSNVKWATEYDTLLIANYRQFKEAVLKRRWAGKPHW